MRSPSLRILASCHLLLLTLGAGIACLALASPHAERREWGFSLATAATPLHLAARIPPVERPASVVARPGNSG